MSGLGAALTFTAPGIPLLFMGNEFQEYGTFHEDIPLDWSKARKHAGTLALHRDLISLRRNQHGHSIGLKGRTVHIPVSDNAKKCLVYWRSHEKHPADQVVVAMSFSAQPAEVVIPFPSAGPWIMRLNTDHVTYGGATKLDPPKAFRLDPASAKAKTTLAPYSARIFSLVERPVSISSAAGGKEGASAIIDVCIHASRRKFQ